MSKSENVQLAVVNSEVRGLLRQVAEFSVLARTDAGELVEEAGDEGEGEKGSLENDGLRADGARIGGQEAAKNRVGEEDAERRRREQLFPPSLLRKTIAARGGQLDGKFKEILEMKRIRGSGGVADLIEGEGLDDGVARRVTGDAGILETARAVENEAVDALNRVGCVLNRNVGIFANGCEHSGGLAGEGFVFSRII